MPKNRILPSFSFNLLNRLRFRLEKFDFTKMLEDKFGLICKTMIDGSFSRPFNFDFLSLKPLLYFTSINIK